MLFIFLLLPYMIYLSMKVVLIDPRLPYDKPTIFELFISICLGTLPVFLYWAPKSLIFNFLLAVAISITVTPILFSTCKSNERFSWPKDKIYFSIIKFIFATILIYPLTYFGTDWFLALTVISIFLFLSRFSLWHEAKGNTRSYLVSFLASCYVLFTYYLLLGESKIQPENWASLISFLQIWCSEIGILLLIVLFWLETGRGS